MPLPPNTEKIIPGCARPLLLGLLLFLIPLVCPAQDAPAGQLPSAPATQNGPGSVSGTVTDSDGDSIPGAQVTLSGAGLRENRKAIADGDGYFSFLDVPAGSLTLSVAYAGFGTVTKTVELQPGQDLSTPDVVLAVSADMEVDVSPLSQHDLAEIALKVEEKQRLNGVIPNFYVAYNWHAVPLSPRQKFRLSLRATVDPANFALAGVIAGVEQGTNGFRGYGQGAEGYGKRYGASIADNTVGTLLGGAVFPILLHQDPRFFYKSTGSVISRALYALATAVICKGDNGKWQPNYSSVLGDISAGAVSNTYYPSTNRSGALLTIENGMLNAAEDGIGNLLQEFLFKRITPGTKTADP